ncbi:helix-turn-helix transcriptional regulator [Streptomyces sp. TRM66268-LWL]|uniref:Helix-turn-helix transcriptional regulator n=1 Tax=Streptomyces polyasparticus TaxID=2767826 RepID=A0ABR7SF61_9ACTN|nr:helix-turn-helix transcriptional regulator [Streptomyces polyasparticus]MBC9714048.1 helix-turn-helix transcriptional regulator [Streptomyces polyasparticus]
MPKETNRPDADAQAFRTWLAEELRKSDYDVDDPRAGVQTRLGAELGVSQSSISRLLRGQGKPDIGLLTALSRHLAIDLRELLIRSGRVAETDLPAPGAPTAPPRGSLTPEEAADGLGITGEDKDLFTAWVRRLRGGASH